MGNTVMWSAILKSVWSLGSVERLTWGSASCYFVSGLCAEVAVLNAQMPAFPAWGDVAGSRLATA